MEQEKRRFVAYRRVSGEEQGRSGLGLEAQLRDIRLYLDGIDGAVLLDDFVEVASGGKGDRAVLAEALEACRRQRATLLVAKLDRLSRNVAFIANLLDDRSVEFLVAALPQADRFALHIYAALAEQKRTFCSLRTKAALAAAKERGVKLGGARHHLSALNERKRELMKAEADKLSPLVLPMRTQGKSLQAVCKHLNDLGVRTRTGGVFHPSKMARLVALM